MSPTKFSQDLNRSHVGLSNSCAITTGSLTHIDKLLNIYLGSKCIRMWVVNRMIDTCDVNIRACMYMYIHAQMVSWWFCFHTKNPPGT